MEMTENPEVLAAPGPPPDGGRRGGEDGSSKDAEAGAGPERPQASPPVGLSLCLAAERVLTPNPPAPQPHSLAQVPQSRQKAQKGPQEPGRL